MKSELIGCDRLVIGLHNIALLEKLPMDSILTLDKAKRLIRQQETVHEQQDILRDGSGTGSEHELEYILFLFIKYKTQN